MQLTEENKLHFKRIENNVHALVPNCKTKLCHWQSEQKISSEHGLWMIQIFMSCRREKQLIKCLISCSSALNFNTVQIWVWVMFTIMSLVLNMFVVGIQLKYHRAEKYVSLKDEVVRRVIFFKLSASGFFFLNEYFL